MAFNLQGRKEFAPETAVGTGAAEPLVDEFEAAKQVPSVDENSIKGGRSKNQPDDTRTIKNSGDPVGDPASDEKSTGEDEETRHVADDAHADDDKVNKPAAETRPKAPQATKASRKRKEDA